MTRSTLTRQRAFTLLEVLTATAVLALSLVMMFQVTEGIQRSTRLQNQQMDSVATARRALDVIVTDLQTAVTGRHGTLLGNTTASGETRLAALTARRGPAGVTGHRFLAVHYSLDTNGSLWRPYRSVTFSETNLLDAAAQSPPAPAPPAQPLARGILALRFFAVTQNGQKFDIQTPAAPGAGWAATASFNNLPVPAGWQALQTAASDPLASSAVAGQRVAALEIWLAAVDPQSLDLLQSAGKVPDARAALAGPPAGWRQAFDTANIPSPAKSALRILNRTVPLP